MIRLIRRFYKHVIIAGVVLVIGSVIALLVYLAITGNDKGSTYYIAYTKNTVLTENDYLISYETDENGLLINLEVDLVYNLSDAITKMPMYKDLKSSPIPAYFQPKGGTCTNDPDNVPTYLEIDSDYFEYKPAACKYEEIDSSGNPVAGVPAEYTLTEIIGEGVNSSGDPIINRDYDDLVYLLHTPGAFVREQVLPLTAKGLGMFNTTIDDPSTLTVSEFINNIEIIENGMLKFQDPELFLAEVKALEELEIVVGQTNNTAFFTYYEDLFDDISTALAEIEL